MSPGEGTVDELVRLLDLEELDTDLYRGVNESVAAERPQLFGGQVAAQALRAAAHTVPEGRLPNSLHGYFLRPGRGDRPVVLRVARDRDGRSFSARHVVALQDGEAIFSMSASFGTPRPGAEWSSPRTPAAQPEDIDDRIGLARIIRTVRIKPLEPTFPYPPGEWPLPARVWLCALHPLPDDPILHACALTYMSDVGCGFGDGTVPGVERGGSSIDHALWFHEALRADDWVLLEMWPLKAGGGRGLYAGTMQDRDGRVGAMLTQEILFRRPEVDWPAPRSGRPPAAGL